MPGELDPLYVVARRVLLDGFEAMGAHRDALILVGAQAVYLHVGEADLAVAPYTTDADFALNPQRLAAIPLLEGLMAEAGFRHGSQPGIWLTTRHVEDRAVDVELDLLVPDSLGGGGRRGARLPEHGNNVARKARGLEAALIDNALIDVASLDSGDPRSYRILVAGPSALLVAKLHKLGERGERNPERLKPKDAHDVLRLLRGVETQTFAVGLERLRADALSASVTREAIQHLRDLFGRAGALGSRLAAEAAAGLEPADTVTASCAALANDLLDQVPSERP